VVADAVRLPATAHDRTRGEGIWVMAPTMGAARGGGVRWVPFRTAADSGLGWRGVGVDRPRGRGRGPGRAFDADHLDTLGGRLASPGDVRPRRDVAMLRDAGQGGVDSRHLLRRPRSWASAAAGTPRSSPRWACRSRPPAGHGRVTAVARRSWRSRTSPSAWSMRPPWPRPPISYDPATEPALSSVRRARANGSATESVPLDASGPPLGRPMSWLYGRDQGRGTRGDVGRPSRLPRRPRHRGGRRPGRSTEANTRRTTRQPPGVRTTSSR
jgi:hypothetical protein